MNPTTRKLLWRSRRGMLELDTLLRRYLTQNGDDFNARQSTQFEKLLGYKDRQLYDAFCGKTPLPDTELNALLGEIKRSVEADAGAACRAPTNPASPVGAQTRPAQIFSANTVSVGSRSSSATGQSSV